MDNWYLRDQRVQIKSLLSYYGTFYACGIVYKTGVILWDETPNALKEGSSIIMCYKRSLWCGKRNSYINAYEGVLQCLGFHWATQLELRSMERDGVHYHFADKKKLWRKSSKMESFLSLLLFTLISIESVEVVTDSEKVYKKAGWLNLELAKFATKVQQKLWYVLT